MTITINVEQAKLLKEILHEYQGFAPSTPRGREKKKFAEMVEKLIEANADFREPARIICD